MCSYGAHCQGSLNDYLGFELYLSVNGFFVQEISSMAEPGLYEKMCSLP
jgi:hypothetical protein